MKVYLDACAISRLTDDPSQQRVHDEAEAVEKVLDLVSKDQAEWLASTAIEIELGRNPHEERRHDALALLAHANVLRHVGDAALDRALVLENLGYGAFDALHLASAEELGVDVLLTTDDRFIRLAARMTGNSSVRVMNPINWHEEFRETKHGHS